MLKEAEVLMGLLMTGEVKQDKCRICSVIGRTQNKEGLYKPLWIIQTDKGVLEFSEDHLTDAVDTFLGIVNASEAFIEVPDAELLKKHQISKDTYRYNHWCDERASELSMIAESIILAENCDSRTIWFDVPQSEVENYVRFFCREHHYRVTTQTYSDKKGVVRVTLDWHLTDSDKKRLRK